MFLPSFGEGQRGVLLRHAAAVVYTPHNEHFGIVPLEAMCVWREKREVDASTSASSPSRPCACGVRACLRASERASVRACVRACVRIRAEHRRHFPLSTRLVCVARALSVCRPSEHRRLGSLARHYK